MDEFTLSQIYLNSLLFYISQICLLRGKALHSYLSQRNWFSLVKSISQMICIFDSYDTKEFLTWLCLQILIDTSWFQYVHGHRLCYLASSSALLSQLVTVIEDIRIALSRVLRSNLRELELFSNNRILYQQNYMGLNSSVNLPQMSGSSRCFV